MSGYLLPAALAVGLAAIAAAHPNGMIDLDETAEPEVYSVRVVEEDDRGEKGLVRYLVVLGNGTRGDGTSGMVPTVVKR